MTPGKPSSPVAKALAKVSGAKAEEEQTTGTPVGAAAPAGHASGAPVNAAGSAPSAPMAPPARNGSGSSASGSLPSAAAGPATAFPTAPVGSVPPGVLGAPGAAGGAAVGAAAGAAGASAAYGSGSSAASAGATTTQARPAAPAPAATGRRVRLTVARVDPWSVMKISFLVSVAIGIAFVVMVAVLWLILDGMGVFTSVNRTISDVAGANSSFDLMDYIGFGRVVSLAIVIGVIDVILLTALSTLGAFLYNVCSSLVGGLQLTLTDD